MPIASRAPPVLYLARVPALIRVPSGKITIQNPLANRSRPWATICCSAWLPALRLIVIGEASANAQPKNGSHSNSRLATNEIGKKILLSATVSKVDECFDRIRCDVAGMFSRPITT